MNTALWIVQGLLAAMFTMGGSMKAFKSIDELALKMPWAKEIPAWQVRFIGITQLLAALGLVLPRLTGILPVLTPVAALGLVFTMASAAVFHLKRNEMQAIGINMFLLSLALFVAVGRLFLVP
jgi:uncharacterized membrane protein YphA (DoxX/SURF4 family)